jgi:septal ring factor EnvC (AmiA/AmiB activator)
MTAAFARAAQESSEGAGELEQTRAALAQKESEIHYLRNDLHSSVLQKEEQAEQLDELFDMYNALREQRTLELEDLEEELQRLGLTLELPPPKPPKRGSWMAKKISKVPYNVLLSGQFKIALR